MVEESDLDGDEKSNTGHDRYSWSCNSHFHSWFSAYSNRTSLSQQLL